MFPFPNQMTLWPNFKSPLVWDLFAVSTYFTVSLLFWYVGPHPRLRQPSRPREDLERVGKIRRTVYGAFALGWRGANRHWQNYERAYLILAALSTPLVLSVHSVVSFDFATSVIPGWHTTIFPPYFVAGAVFSGFAMVMTLALITRAIYGMKSRHHDQAPRADEQDHPRDGAASLATRTRWSSSSPGTPATAYEAYHFFHAPRVRPVLVGVWTLMMSCNVIVAADLLVQEDAPEHPGDVRRVASSSTSGCGSSASSSS